MARKKKLTSAKVNKLIEAISKEIDAISDYEELNKSLINEIKETLLFYHPGLRQKAYILPGYNPLEVF